MLVLCAIRECEARRMGRHQAPARAAHIEAPQRDHEKPTDKQHRAAIRMGFDWLITVQLLAVYVEASGVLENARWPPMIAREPRKCVIARATKSRSMRSRGSRFERNTRAAGTCRRVYRRRAAGPTLPQKHYRRSAGRAMRERSPDAPLMPERRRGTQDPKDPRSISVIHLTYLLFTRYGCHCLTP